MAKKLSSFTMIELVVAMLISSIVISIVFYSFSLVWKQLNARIKRSAMMSEYVSFKTAFTRDIDRAGWVRDSLDGRQLLLGVEGHVLSYSIGPSFLLRQLDGSVDTFFVGGSIEQENPVSDTVHLIKSLQLNIFVNADSITLSIYKPYTVRELLLAENTGNE